MNKKEFFNLIQTTCDWGKTGDDEKVLSPLISYLSQQSDEEIFSFDEWMAELLFELDTEKIFKTACKYFKHTDDSFLYSRCCALTDGEAYYEKVKAGKARDLWEMEFEAILAVPAAAWGKKHEKESGDYPHVTAKSYETGSNAKGWNQ